LFIGLAGLHVSAQAQTEQGNTLLGLSVGDLSYGRRTADDLNLSAAISPTAGWFVADNLALLATASLGYSYTKKQDFFGEAAFRQFDKGFSPGVRYYVVGQGKHQVFGQASFDFLWTNYTVRYDRQGFPESARNEKLSYRSVSGGLGYNYFVTPNAALEALIGYQHPVNMPGPDIRPPKSLLVNLGFSLFLPSGRAAAAE
jgi:outer membrane protein